MGSPAETVGLSAVLVTVTSARRRVILAAGDVGLPSLVVVTPAVLETVPLGQGPVAPVVGLVTWTEVVAPAARSAGPKPSTPALMAQPGSELAMLQLRPAFFFSDSATTEIYTLSLQTLFRSTV